MRFCSKVSARVFALPAIAIGAGVLVSGCGGGSSSSGGSTPGGGGLSSSTLVFVSTRDGNQEIYSMRSDGTATVRLTNNAAADSSPSRSRDGRRIVFSSMRDGNAEIYTMGPGGETDNLRRLTADSGAFAPEDTDPILSPDGTKILWTSTRGGRIGFWTMSFDGTNQEEIPGANAVSLLNTSWHPNNVRFLGTRQTSPGNWFLGNFTAGGPFTNLTTVTQPQHPRYSPDGTKITLVQRLSGDDVVTYLNADGTGTTSLPVTSAGATASGPSWSLDSQRIVWASTVSGQRQLFVIRPGDAAGTQITTTGENFSPSWGE